MLATGANAALGVTFDDETMLSLSAHACIDDFVYEKGAKGNKAVLNVARGTVAFVASLVAKTGDMTIMTPTSTLGIRGTTGVVDIVDNAAAGGAGEAKIKLYPDADGRVGRIDVFSRQGERLGALTKGSSDFAIRPGAGGRSAAAAEPATEPSSQSASRIRRGGRALRSSPIRTSAERQSCRAEARLNPAPRRNDQLPR